jgi:hypothetical protein
VPQMVLEDGDDDSQLLYNESRKRAGVDSPSAHGANDGAPQGASVQALDTKDLDETDDEETQDERATPEKETAACSGLVALPQEDLEADTPPEPREEDKDGSPPSSPILISNRASVSLMPSSFRATTLSLCDVEPERDAPEQGAKAARTETGEESVVGRKKGRPAPGDQQALPQESQETLPLK